MLVSRSTLRFIPPMMPELVDQPPEAGEWTHEIKHDGYRTQLIVEDGTARAFTRRGFDWTLKYRPVVRERPPALQRLRERKAFHDVAPG